jgi:hypothetical protein
MVVDSTFHIKIVSQNQADKNIANHRSGQEKRMPPGDADRQ